MKIYKDFTFEASHIIPNHPGKCRNLHGHSWKVRVAICQMKNAVTGMVCDYADIKAAVQPIIQRLDHQHLNWFMQLPTSENLAVYIAYHTWPRLGVIPEVEVAETATSVAIFDPARDREEEFEAEPSCRRQWQSPMEDVVIAFRTMQTRAVAYYRKRQELDRLLAKMHTVGAWIKNFEQYRDTLDPLCASELLQELERLKQEETAASTTDEFEIQVKSE